MANYNNKVESKAESISRHNKILQTVLFEPRNNSLFSEKGSKYADERLKCLILQQLPAFQDGGICGIKFDKIDIEKDKLTIQVVNQFEAIWRLEFKTAKPILVLYDFRIDIESLNDQFLNYGKELDADELKKMSKTK